MNGVIAACNGKGAAVYGCACHWCRSVFPLKPPRERLRVPTGDFLDEEYDRPRQPNLAGRLLGPEEG